MFNKLFNPRENCVEVTALLIDGLNAHVTYTTIEKNLTSHPNYPSAASIADVLNSLHISNLSFSVTNEFLSKVSDPFITLVESDQYHIDMYTLVKPVTEDQLNYFDPDQHTWKTVDHKTFLSKWEKNFVMLYEAEERVEEEDFKKKQVVEWRNNLYKYLTYLSLPIIALLAIALNLVRSGAAGITASIYMVLTLVGCVISVLLSGFDIDKHNPVLKNICGKGKKVNCGAILASDGAKIAGISWSRIGFTYFAGQLLLGLFYILTNQPALLSVVFITNAIAVPYIIYSITFQYLAKHWCSLCLMVQLVLALQFTVSISSGWDFIHHPDGLLQPQLIALVMLSFALPAIVLSILMPALLSSKEGNHAAKELIRLKHNPQVFELLLKKQKTITLSPENLGVKLGAGKNKIIKVCNPYCMPCSEAHTTIEEMLRTNPDVEVQIIYWIRPTEPSSDVVKHFIAIERLYGSEKLKDALDYWYLTGKRDYVDFAAKFPIDVTLLEEDAALGRMHNWCTEEQISFTPTFFVNGYQMPDTYDVNDLKYLLAN